jgi:hypothetical protein
MTAVTEPERWKKRRNEVRGKNRALLVALLALCALFYFIAIVRMGAQP